MTDGRPELAASLAPFAASVDQVALSLEIAGSLPVIKRASAQRRIDQALDQLEMSLFEASLPGATE